MEQPHAPNGFVLATCRNPICGIAPDRAQMEEMRQTVRSTPRGVLVSTDCLNGLCKRVQHAETGFSAVVQPADGVTATGPPCIVGPIAADAHLVLLCRWLTRFGTRNPPSGLRNRIHQLHAPHPN